MPDIGASTHFDEGKGGSDHQTVYGDGWHRSWDIDRDNNVTRDHITIHWDSGNQVLKD